MKGDYRAAVALTVVVLLAFALLIISAQKNSQTTDEGVHLYAGYTYLTKRDFRFDPEHPPLLKEVGALPLLFSRDLKLPPDELWNNAADFYKDSWREARSSGEAFLYSAGNDPKQLLFRGRFPFIILTIVLGLFAFFWARKLYGSKAGVFAAFLTLLFPNILAHGNLINTDLGLTLFIFVAIYFWGKYLKSPNWRDLCLSGLFVGLAFASKYTSILLIPIFVILTIEKTLFDRRMKKLAKYSLGFAAVIIISFVMVWASYGFSTDVPPATSNSLLQSNAFSGGATTSTLNAIFQKSRPLLFPAAYFKGLFYVSNHALSGHRSFLLGMRSGTGWWYYFLIAIFYKTPIPIFLLLVVTIAYFAKTASPDRFDEFLLITPAVIFLGLAMFSKTDLGIRHILPIFPFVFVFISKSINLVFRPAAEVEKKQPRRTIFPALGFLLLGLWYLYSAIASCPNYLAYFNEFAGGPKGGYRILTDSNLDWGQDIYRIKNYLAENNISRYYMIYSWDGDPALKYFGLQPLPLPRYSSEVTEKFVISATALQNGRFEWLKRYPARQITPGVFVFETEG